MNPQNTLTYIKLAIVGLMLAGIFVLAALGKIDAQVAITSAVGAVGALVVALGISSAGGAAATAIQAQTRAMVARGEAVDAADQVKRGVLAKADQRGFAALRNLVALTLGGIVGLVGYAIVAVSQPACSGGISSGTATDVQVGVNAVACIIINSAVDTASGMSPAQTVADLVSKCGASVAQIATIFDAQAAAADKSPASAAQFRALSAAAHATDGGK